MRLKRSSLGQSGVLGAVAVVTVLLGAERSAKADLFAAYVQGYGGLSAPQIEAGGGQSSGVSPALGVQAGARLLGLELYGDYTSYGSGSAVERAILGLRLGFSFGDTRLELRGGGGAIGERGGALTGTAGAPNRAGVVARAGVDLERQIAKALLIGVAVNGETFALDNTDASATLPHSSWIRGSDVFASLHLKFELGI